MPPRLLPPQLKRFAGVALLHEELRKSVEITVRTKRLLHVLDLTRVGGYHKLLSSRPILSKIQSEQRDVDQLRLSPARSRYMTASPEVVEVLKERCQLRAGLLLELLYRLRLGCDGGRVSGLLLQRCDHEVSHRPDVPPQHVSGDDAGLPHLLHAQQGEQLQHLASGQIGVDCVGEGVSEGERLEEGNERLRVELLQVDCLRVRTERRTHRVGDLLVAVQHVEGSEGLVALEERVDGGVGVDQVQHAQRPVFVHEQHAAVGVAVEVGETQRLVDEEKRGKGQLLDGLACELVVDGQHVGIHEEEGRAVHNRLRGHWERERGGDSIGGEGKRRVGR